MCPLPYNRTVLVLWKYQRQQLILIKSYLILYKEYLKYCLVKIENLLNKYKLKLNKKTKIYNSLDEIEFLGFRFMLDKRIIMKVTNKTKKRFKKRLSTNNISSYIGHLKYGCCNELIYRTCKNQ